jgi:hypothetical protein
MEKIKIAAIITGLLVALTVVPAYALEGSMGPARMTLHTEIPFMSPQRDTGVIEVSIRVANTANEPERIMFSTTDDLNNSDIMTVIFAEEQLVLMPKEERVVNVTFKVKKPGTFSGNIVTLFASADEKSGSAIGSTVGFRLNSKVSIVAASKGPGISLYSIGALGFVGSMVLIGIVLYKRKRRREEEQEETENKGGEKNKK